MFGKLFGKSENAEIDERIVREMAEFFVMMCTSPSQAREMARDILKMAKDEITNAGERDSMYRVGDGNYLLAAEDQNENIGEFLGVRRRHGASDEDIRRWHNLCQLERSALLIQDQLLLVSTYRTAKSQGKSEDEAAELVKKTHPRYTPNAEKIGEDGHEDLLPVELKLRVNDYRLMLVQQNPSKLQNELASSSSFNSWVMEKLSSGEL